MNVNLASAVRTLMQNRLQTWLTLCGMSVGIAMVVIVSGLGRGAQLRVEQQIESAGPTRITVRSGNFRPAAVDMTGEQDTGGGEQAEGQVNVSPLSQAEIGDNALADAVVAARRRTAVPRRTNLRTPPTPLDDAHRNLLARISDVRAVAATLGGNLSTGEDSAGGRQSIRVEGFEPAHPDMMGWTIVSGRLIDKGEHRGGASVMLVTPAIAAKLWPDLADPLGQSVTIGGRVVKLVGVISGQPAQPMVVVPTIYVPLGLARTLLGRRDYDSIMVRSNSVGVTTKVAQTIKDRLRKLHRLPEDTLDDFRIETQSVAAMPGMGTDPRLSRAVHSNVVGFEQAAWEEMAKSLREANRTFTLLLAAAAAVSLLVGGIGVMNIMLVSITARTREIGLRMAVGARARDVTTQFLVEAMLLATIGGLLGILLGAAGLAGARFGFDWAASLSPGMLGLALAMATLTGVVFGYGPARRAAALDPAVALKAE